MGIETVLGAVAAPVIGGLLGGGGSSGGTTTSTVDNSPWGPAQGYLLGTSGTGGTRQLRPGAVPISGGERRRVRDPDTEAWTWETTPVQYAESDYITTGDTGGTPGVLPEAANQYAAGQWTPEQQAIADAYRQQTLTDQYNNFGSIGQAGNDLLANGVPAVQNAQTSTMQATNVPTYFGYSARTVNNPVQSQAQGYTAAQATASSIGDTPRDANINALLAGDYNNPYLNQQIDTATGRLTDNFNEQVMPAIGQGATMAGQYGGSRHGIAEGLAARGLTQSMGDLEGSMRNNAYNQGFGARTAVTGQLIGTDTQRDLTGAQLGTQVSLNNAGAQNAANQFEANSANTNSMFNAGQANNIALSNAQMQNAAEQWTQGNYTNNAQFNANAANQAASNNQNANNNMNQFNANLGLQNNVQNVNAMTTAGNMIGTGATGQNDAFSNYMNTLNMPNAQNQANLNNYSNIVNATAGQGGVQSSSQPYYTNPMGNALGLASGALGVYNQGANAGLWGNSSVPTSPNTAAAFGANPVMNFGQSGNSLFNSFG